MHHSMLLGDSIVEHDVHVGGGPGVRSQREAPLTPDWCVTLLEVGGHQSSDVARQLQRLPADASHLVVSIGGNDVSEDPPFLIEAALSVAEVLGGER